MHEWYIIHPGACTAYAKDLFLIKVSCMTIYYVYAYIPQDKNRQRPTCTVCATLNELKINFGYIYMPFYMYLFYLVLRLTG